MNRRKVGKKYGKALITSVNLADAPKVIGELKAFRKLLESNRKMELLFAGKIFTDEEKRKAFRALLPHLKISAQTEKFLTLLIAEGTLDGLKEIIATSVNLFNEKQKKASALVISPVSLDSPFLERLRAALGKMTDKQIDIDHKIDPSLLGGFIVRVGSTVYDSSLKGQLRLLRAELAGKYN